MEFAKTVDVNVPSALSPLISMSELSHSHTLLLVGSFPSLIFASSAPISPLRSAVKVQFVNIALPYTAIRMACFVFCVVKEVNDVSVRVCACDGYKWIVTHRRY